MNEHECNSCSNSRRLSPAAQVAFDAIRWLIDLSRKRAHAGKAGSIVGGQDTRFAPGKRDFAPGKPAGTPPQPLDQIDVLAGLDAFLS